ncbi:MAG: ATP-binding cassette domain-containing protein [Acidobacteriota bacterium]|nr:ATP-binding cassette domain-containing protein [Acidobacteriota bacterium]
MIQFFRVFKEYPGPRMALDGVTFRISRGEFVFLTGASGAGKTTLLRLIYRAEVPTNGRIIVNGRNVVSLPAEKVPFLRRTMGIVFQDFGLIPSKTVFENVSYLPRILGVSSRALRLMAEDILDRVGLGDRLDVYPSALSGGEQQRVAIARAVINKPELLIADEPAGNLDPELSLEIIRLFAEINKQGTTVLLATHDPSIQTLVGDRILALDRGVLVRNDILRPGAVEQ